MPRIGRVGDQNNQDPDVIGARKFFELATSNSRLVTTAVQTVGSKGCDGFRLAWYRHSRSMETLDAPPADRRRQAITMNTGIGTGLDR